MQDTRQKGARKPPAATPPSRGRARHDPFVFLSLLIICLGIAQAVLAVVRYRDAYFRVKMVDVAASISDYAKKLRRVAERSDKEPVNDATCNVEAFRTVRILGFRRRTAWDVGADHSAGHIRGAAARADPAKAARPLLDDGTDLEVSSSLFLLLLLPPYRSLSRTEAADGRWSAA